MTAPLYEALRHHQALQRASFHTPGHKSASGALPKELFSLAMILTFQEMNNFSICRYRLNSGTGRPFLKRKDGYFFPLYLSLIHI